MKNIFKEKAPRQSDGDVFLAQKLKSANFNTGFYEIPSIEDVKIKKPKKLVLWSKRHNCQNKSECGLIFYEYDSLFDGKNGLYNILKYGSEKEISTLIDELKEFSFVVCPDYSVYGNFPIYKQIDSICRSREAGYILSTYGIKVIVNYRSTYEWSYEIALSGIELNAIVAIGTLGCLKDIESRTLLKNGIDMLVQNIKPRIIIVYGLAPNKIFENAINNEVEIWQYDSAISEAFKGKK